MALLLAKPGGDTPPTILAQRVWTPDVRQIALTGSLMDWARAPGNPAHNAMTKAVANGDAGYQAPVLRQAPGHVSSCAVFDREDYLSHWQKYYGSALGSDVEATINSDQQLLSLALAVIDERFEFVGLVEYFEESVSRLSSLLRITPYDHASKQHSSASTAQGDIPADVVEELQARNMLDVGLFNAVLNGKFWKSSAAASRLVEMRLNSSTSTLTWQSILDGEREGAVFDPSILAPKTH